MYLVPMYQYRYRMYHGTITGIGYNYRVIRVPCPLTGADHYTYNYTTITVLAPSYSCVFEQYYHGTVWNT